MIGKLNERVSLQRVTLANDSEGGQTETWTQYAEVWARIQPMKGRERQASERQEQLSDYVVTIRYRSDVRVTDKIVWRSRDLNIRFSRDAGPQPQYLEIECELGAAS